MPTSSFQRQLMAENQRQERKKITTFPFYIHEQFPQPTVILIFKWEAIRIAMGTVGAEHLKEYPSDDVRPTQISVETHASTLDL